MSLAGTLFLASVPLLISLYAEKYRLEDFNLAFPNDPTDFGLPVPETFDYIVVGGGTAGCIMAGRLSEKFTVLLLEGGGTPPPIQALPLNFHLTRDHPDINYLYKSVPQTNAALSFGGIIVSTTGKMLGGSSSHNGMMCERGHPRDYGRWANAVGDESWSYENVLKYFKKSENFVGKMDVNEDQHGYDGPMHIQEDTFSPGGDIWLEAGKELGYKITDSNGPQQVGFSSTQFTKRNGRRESTYTAYIKPIEKTRKNLKIYRYSFASEIIFDDHKRAIGVSYTRHGIPRAAFANKEVILSAGSFVSPLILIKSGIGPKDQLKAAKVKPLSILPVGEGLMDHPLLFVEPIYIDKPEFVWSIKRNMTFEDFNEYIHEGTGPLTGVYQGNNKAFIASSRNSPEKGLNDWADLMVYYRYMSDGELNLIRGYVGMQNIQTRGTIKLNTSATSMADNNLPLIDFNYFDDDSDIDVAVDGINFFLDVIEKTETFQKIGARFGGKPIEQCKELTFRSNEYWRCYVKHETYTTWHPVGTCRMGKGVGDPKAVVDTKARVIGVKSLRVVDASIIPYVNNANTYAPTMMLAEKIAEEILNGELNEHFKSEL